jgi:cholesterol transport system auxiliary component
MQNRFFLPTRRLILAGGTSLFLSGCGSLGDLLGPGAPPQLYVLKPELPAPAPGPKVPWSLSIALPDASGDLDSTRIAITRSSTTMDYYANAAWPDELPPLLQSLLIAAFRDSGRIASVARESDAIRDDYLLLTEIRDFAAHYSDPDGAPTITVTIAAQMATAHGRAVAANLTASHNQPANANSIDAAVQAMNAALGACLGDIVAWALALPPPPPASTR